MALATTLFDAAEYLDTPEAMAAYLDAALETGNPEFIAAALGDIAKAKGMSQIAKDAGVSRDSLYKSLREGGNPTLATFLGVMKSIGLGLKTHTNA